MSANLHFAPRTFSGRLADLDFTVELPADWIAHDIPQVDADFSNPTTLAPLAIITAPHAAIVMAFAARPAYDDGSLHDWAWYLLGQNQLKPAAVSDHRAGELPAIVGEASQDSDVGPLIVRFAFAEDGARLINLTYTCPEALDSAVRDVWFQALTTFALARPRGSTVPLFSPAAPPSSAAPADATDADGLAAEHNGSPVVSEATASSAFAEDDPSVRSNGASAVPNDGQPEWWHRALHFEAEGRFEEAERSILQGVQHIGGVSSIAQMYSDRMVRLQQSGDTEGALQAFHKADQWIFHYASLATSGGEGAALSRERDQFRKQLVNLYGSDPAAT